KVRGKENRAARKSRKGDLQAELGLPLSAGDGYDSGTLVRFKPDPQVFDEETSFSFDTLAQRLRELAFLNSGLRITLADERTWKAHDCRYDGGLVEFVKFLNQMKTPLHSKPIHFSRVRDDVEVEFALQYNDSYAENVYSYVNNISTTEGG